MEFFSSLWDDASRDLEAEAAHRLYITARIGAQPAWSFLANATTEDDFAMRLEYAQPRLILAAQAACRDNPEQLREVYAKLVDGLWEDFQVLAKDNEKNKSKPWENGKNDDRDPEGDKENDSDEDENDSDNENDPDSDSDDDDNDDDDAAGEDSHEDNEDGDEDDDEGPEDKKGNPFGRKKAGSRKTAGWVIVNEKNHKKVKGPFESKAAALDVIAGMGEGFAIEQETEGEE